ncbi:hypothetical protein ACWEQC_22125 [Streptomyces shenzhenensis]
MSDLFAPATEDEDAELPFFVDIAARREPCLVCRNEEPSLLTSTFTATTGNGTYEIGCFACCLVCQDAPYQHPEAAHGR